jgi:predicted HTH transcriptional regulator
MDQVGMVNYGFERYRDIKNSRDMEEVIDTSLRHSLKEESLHVVLNSTFLEKGILRALDKNSFTIQQLAMINSVDVETVNQLLSKLSASGCVKQIRSSRKNAVFSLFSRKKAYLGVAASPRTEYRLTLKGYFEVHPIFVRAKIQ